MTRPTISPPRAILADDEPHLLAYLETELHAAWPELRVAGRAANGLDALRLIDEHAPEVAFLDIRMPGLSGLDVAGRLAGQPRRPQIVFITAYEQYAVAAFEQCALDYLLKPPTAERIGQTVVRLKAALARADDGVPLDRLAQLLAQLGPAPAAPAAYLQWIRAAHAGATRLIDIAEVLYFQSNDKYTSVVTRDGESLIRTPLADLRAQLDPAQFWQIHRGTVVAARAICGTRHDLRGRLVVRLKERPEQLVVSRNFAAQFKQM